MAPSQMPWAVTTESGSLVHVFEQYAKQIDDFNLRMEAVRIVSREITKDSKNAIFLLHRSGPNNFHKIMDQAKAALDKVRLKFGRLAAAVESDHEFYRFQHSISQGVQEYIEAESFHYFLSTNGGLISKEQLVDKLVSACAGLERFPILTTDYLQGIADLSGEVMRKSINWATSGDIDSVKVASRFMQDLLVYLQGLPLHHIRGWQMKIETLQASTSKVENALFKLQLKRIEFPDQPLKMTTEQFTDEDRPAAADPVPS